MVDEIHQAVGSDITKSLEFESPRGAHCPSKTFLKILAARRRPEPLPPSFSLAASREDDNGGQQIMKNR